MGKPQIKLRKPSNVQVFIDGGEVQVSSSSDVRKSGRPSRSRKQVTVYLSPDLAKKLKMKAVELDQEMSELTEAALTQYLAG